MGRPLDDCDINPDTIVEFVGQHFAAGGGATSFSDPPRPPAPGTGMAPAFEPANPEQEPLAVFYVVNNTNPQGQWHLQAFSAADGQLVHSVPLPSPGAGGYYSVICSGGEFAVAMPGMQPVPCQDLLVGFESEGSSPPPPGVAAHSAILPGMAAHGTGGIHECSFV